MLKRPFATLWYGGIPNKYQRELWISPVKYWLFVDCISGSKNYFLSQTTNCAFLLSLLNRIYLLQRTSVCPAIIHSWRENIKIHTFSEGISAIWNAINFVLDLNSSRRVIFLRWNPLRHKSLLQERLNKSKNQLNVNSQRRILTKCFHVRWSWTVISWFSIKVANLKKEKEKKKKTQQKTKLNKRKKTQFH